MSASQEAKGADFSQGIDRATLTDGATLCGHVGDEAALLSRRGDQYFAVSGSCTHYGGQLAEGVIEGDLAHCPLHHACFDLRTGEALTGPAFSPLKRWRVDVSANRLTVSAPLADAAPQKLKADPSIKRIVIIGGGAAGFAAAEMLRRRGFDGALTMLSEDSDAPYDRPNLSKDYLAGEAPEEWMPLRDDAFYKDSKIDLQLATKVAKIDTGARTVTNASGQSHAYDRLLIATGATPIHPPGYAHSRVHTLRSFADCRALIEAAKTAKRAVVVGSGFIGLETAAALRHLGIAVDVVAPEASPMLKLLGEDISKSIQAVHEKHGVRFHFGEKAAGFDGAKLQLESGKTLEADLLVLGMGVKPNTQLAEAAGLKVSNGIEVDAYLRTSDAHIFAAGDVARYPDPVGAETARVEHWVAAQRQGQFAAINMLGAQTPFTATPFFWSNHYEDLHLHYVGYASSWERVDIDGDVNAGAYTARYIRNGRVIAAVSNNRNKENVRIQLDMGSERRKTSAQA
ncbi:MAG: FAD-dependent oxidoreductase [Terricaulis sp.]